MANRKSEKYIQRIFKCKILYREKIHNKRLKVDNKYNSGVQYLVYTDKNSVFMVYPKDIVGNVYKKRTIALPMMLKNKVTNFSDIEEKHLHKFIKEAKQFINRKKNNEK